MRLELALALVAARPAGDGLLAARQADDHGRQEAADDRAGKGTQDGASKAHSLPSTLSIIPSGETVKPALVNAADWPGLAPRTWNQAR